MTTPTQQGPQGQRPAGRPGAMTMAMQAVQVRPPTGPKVLRIGLIQGGKIIEERIIRQRETVSVGTSEKNHFVVQASGLPARFELFQIVGQDYILNFSEAMRGRVALPGGVQELANMRSTGAARNAGSHWQVKLSDTSRGKVVIGDVTLLFQFVVPPPVQPRPQLPAAARGGFVKSIDWLFTAFILFSFMLHFGFVIYLENADWPIDQGINDLPDSVAKMIFAEPPPPPEETPEETPTETEETTEEAAEEAPQQAQAANSRGATRDDNSGNTRESAAEASARIAEQAAASAEALLLGALGGDSGGALADVLAGGAVTGNAEDVLALAQGVGVATGGSGTLRTRGGGGTGSGVGGLGSLAAAGGAGATAQAGEGEQIIERVIRGRINIEDGDAVGGDGEFDSQIVVRQIRARIGAIRACYERELRRNPSLAGKVTVQFTIEQSGSVTRANATENTTNDAAVAACVVGTVARFRFNPGPEGGSVVFSYPFVFAPQN